jgi:hypothetical protein
MFQGARELRRLPQMEASTVLTVAGLIIVVPLLVVWDWFWLRILWEWVKSP